MPLAPVVQGSQGSLRLLARDSAEVPWIGRCRSPYRGGTDEPFSFFARYSSQWAPKCARCMPSVAREPAPIVMVQHIYVEYGSPIRPKVY